MATPGTLVISIFKIQAANGRGSIGEVEIEIILSNLLHEMLRWVPVQDGDGEVSI